MEEMCKVVRVMNPENEKSMSKIIDTLHSITKSEASNRLPFCDIINKELSSRRRFDVEVLNLDATTTMDMNSQSPPSSIVFTSDMVANQNDKSLADALRQSILNLCEEHVLYNKQLRVMGVLCLAVDSMDADIVVKLNDSLIKAAPPRSHVDSEKSIMIPNMTLENGSQDSSGVHYTSRRKRKHLRPRRASVHLADGANDTTVNGAEDYFQVNSSDNLNVNSYSSEALACPIVLPGEEDLSIGAIAAASAQSHVGSREEGEISPISCHNASEDTVDGPIVVSEDNQPQCDVSDYQNFRNFTLGTVVNASNYSNTFYIPSGNISELFANGRTLHISTAGIHEIPSQVQFVTINNQQKSTQLAVKHAVSTNADNNRKSQSNSNVHEKEEDTAAKVAKVVAAVQAAAAREREAKLAAAAICGVAATEGARNTHRAIRKRKVCVSPDVATHCDLNDAASAAVDPTSSPSAAVGTSDSNSTASSASLLNKVFTCTFCGKHFNRKFCLERHERLHTGTKPYECLHCNERYIRLEDKKRHMRTNHPDKADCSVSEVDDWSPSPAELEQQVALSASAAPKITLLDMPMMVNSNI